jgi:hypothetical protein
LSKADIQQGANMTTPTTSSLAASGLMPSDGLEKNSRVKIDIQSVEPVDQAQFQAAMNQYADGSGAFPDIDGVGGPAKIKANSNSLGNVVSNRVTGLASEMQQDQQYVSKMLEQATRTGDSMHLMRAMMALNDYQMRVQTVTKTVSKTASSIDSLTKLQ